MDILDYCKCALSYDFKHYIERPVALPCGHCACFDCIQEFKNNTGLKEILCDICKTPNNLKIEYREFLSVQFLIDSNLPIIENALKDQYEDALRGLKCIFLCTNINFYQEIIYFI
jgi:hypothetical protein